MIVNTNPEFGIELTLVVPYAYWLHKQGKLEKVITSKGMRPFYYFCDNVEEKYEYRTVDNQAAGLGTEENPIIPNCWIYGMKEGAELYKDEWPEWEEFADVDRGCGILDYSKWELPDYTTHFKNDKFVFDKPFIVISNRYNWEHGQPPVGYLDIECLYNIFNYLTEKGYNVIYKRPKNTEFPLDQNEINTLHNQETLTANVDGVGLINDYELVNYYDNVYLLDDIVSKHPDFTYNEVQLNLFNNAKGFITMGGGSTLFPCFFKKPTVAYYGGTLTEIRRKCFWEDSKGNKNIKNYHYMINPNLIPFIDKDSIDMNNNYKEFLNTIKQTF
jgi:hypothetical protein|tara:strand:- start:42 stop:1028 length:987 start_codon:yes stop_codon:yes gene_type:complete